MASDTTHILKLQRNEPWGQTLWKKAPMRHAVVKWLTVARTQKRDGTQVNTVHFCHYPRQKWATSLHTPRITASGNSTIRNAFLGMAVL